jgi:hypothetical protein
MKPFDWLGPAAVPGSSDRSDPRSAGAAELRDRVGLGAVGTGPV